MKRLLLPLSLTFLCASCGLSDNSNVKNLFCKGSSDLSIFVNKKTGQLYNFKIDKLFEDKQSNILIPFSGKIESKDFVTEGIAGFKDGLFRAELKTTYFSNGDEDKFFYEINFKTMEGKRRRSSTWRKPPFEITMYNKCEFKDLDKGLKIKDK